MSLIECRHVTKRYGDQVVVNELDWTIEAGQSWAIVGPSGAGKSTLLRMFAGLERCSSGEIRFRANSELQDEKPRIGMVFQHLALWPHLTASQHIECVVVTGSRRERKRVAGELLAEVRLPKRCHEKRPEQLSGGELQRLAIARALAVKPDILLLDEPLAQVDTLLRADLLALLNTLIAEKQMGSIYVTHSWAEATQIAEHVAVIDGGKLIQSGRFAEVYGSPATATVARLTGPVIEIPRAIIQSDRIRLIERETSISMQVDPLVVRPQQLELVACSDLNRWQVRQCRAFGFAWNIVFTNASDEIRATLCRKVCEGDIVGLQVGRMPM